MKPINQQTSTQKLVIIDPRVEAYEILAAGVRDSAQVIIIDPNFDGIEQITEALNNYPAPSLHIVCHGEPGCLHLGKTPINAANIDRYRHQLQQWQISDILLYACNVAGDTLNITTRLGFKPQANSESRLKPTENHSSVHFSGLGLLARKLISGRALLVTENPSTNFLHQLHQLTGANIAASAHPVGNPSKGGTWNLEYQLGNITSPIAFSPEVCNAYPGIFPASFAAPTNFAVGAASPRSVTVGDFNGDGKTDIAAANTGSNNVSVLLGTGTGSFGPATNFAVGTSPFSVTVGDFNGDGKTDIAAANRNSNNVSVLLGTGTGSFGAATNFAVGTGPVSVTVGDFNGDGKTDIAAANSSSNNVSVLLNTTITTVTIAAGATPTESGPTNGTFVITLNSPAPAGGLTVNFALAGTATTTTDYSITAGSNISAVTATSFTIAAGTTTAVINVAPVDDAVIDPSETVQLTLSNGAGYNVGAANNASVTITDNDPLINITAGTAPSESGPTNGTFNITLNAASPTPITVNFDTTGSTATSATDYSFDLASSTNITAITASSFTIAAGVTSATLVAKPVDDAVIEAGGETVKVNLLSDTGYTLNSASATTTFAAATNFTVGTSPFSVTVGDFNGDGKTDIAAANRNSDNVSVLLGTGTGSFGAATNFAAGTNPRSVTVGDFNGDGKTDIAAANSNSNNVSVLLGTGTGSFGAATNFTVGTGPFSVTVGDFNGDGKTDIAAANFNSDNVSVLLNNNQPTATLTIVDNDTDVTLAISPSSVTEDGVTNLIYTFTRAGITTTPLTINFNVGGDGTYNTDYTVSGADTFSGSTGTVTFVANSTTATITVDPTADSTVELDETVQLTLATGSNYNVVTTTAIAGSITNDDADVTLAISPSSVTEDGVTNLIYTFTRAGITTTPLTINFNVGGDGTYNTDYTVSGADTFSGSTGTVTFVANSTTATITVDPTADSTVELDETVQLTLATGSNYNVVTTTAIAGSITNDDATVEFSQASYQVNEDGTVIGATVTLNRTGFTNSTGSVQVQFANGTATGGTDFTNTTQTINFASGDTSKTVTIPINDDILTEGTENFTISLANPSSGVSIGSQNSATVQIIDNDVPPTLSISDISQAEGNSGTTNLNFTVSLNTAAGLPVTVNYATQNSTATTADGDYTSASGSLTFNPGETQKTVSVVVNGDTKYETDETFAVKLTNPTNATIADDTGVGTISNDDPLPAISISNPTAQNEGNSGTVNHSFNITLSNISSQTISVNYNTADGTATTADSDYTSTSGNLIFNPGETQKTITVVSNGDNKYETNETFNLNLTTPVNAAITNGAAVGTINNDDSIPTIAIGDVSQNEGQSGTTNFIFPVTLSNPTYQTVTVNYATANGISTAGVDYNSASGTLTFNPGETQKNITVGVIGNTTVENDKNFLVNLSNLSNAALADNQAVGTILNDDGVPTVSNITKTADEDTTIAFAATDFTSKFTDPNGDSLNKIKITSLPNNGTLQLSSSNVTVNQEISASDLGNIRFIPTADWNGNTSFNWIASDSANYAPNPAAVNLTINPVNDAPFVNAAIPFQTTNTNSLFNFTFATDTFKDIDFGDSLTYSATLANGNTLPNWLFFNPFTRNLVGIPTSSDVGTIVLSVKATDSGNASANTSFALIVNGATVSTDADCFCESIVRPDINNLPGVSVALNLVDITQFGNDSNDTLIGTTVNDAFYGNGGDDLLLGKAGNDNLYGGQGNDTAFGGADRDWISGNQGNDVLNGNAGDDIINGNEGNDTLRGGQDNDLVRGGQNDDLIYGDRGNDTLGGDKGNDTIFGDNDDLSGIDLIFGGSGDDLINGNAGNDTIFGEDGNDTVRGGKNDDIVFGDAGDDILYGDLGNDSLCGGDGNDTMYGGNGSPTPIGPNGDRDELCGGAGNDLLFGNEGEDKLNGEDGDDTLVGGKDNDTLIGGAGNDVLIGDLGNDLLTGGSDRDTFILTSGKGSDIITDFQDGQDLMSLGGGLSFGQLAIGQSSNNTIITVKSSNELLATFNGIQANLINQQDFI